MDHPFDKGRAGRPEAGEPQNGDWLEEEGGRGADVPPDLDGSKAIILFSDGTGNSSGKLFKTNVWRMYEAVDLGPPAKGKREQVAFYDNGVGTSGVAIWAMITGVFGYGLKRNVLDIYRYACRNYRPAPGQAPGPNPADQGDHLYGFGFSRGGFTMRIVAALIASQGLIAAGSERELNRRTADAYRAFRKDFLPGRFPWPVKFGRVVRDAAIGGWRKLFGSPAYDAAKNYRPVIRFLGIWDTVSAYGGPVLELTRAIDDWIFPLSMPNYELDERVQLARHALALDDRRDAFHPLLWDENHEHRLIEEGKVAPDRLQQIWFAGMHADVGGGYPDESLSYVSLLWILEEAEKAGLRTLNVITDRHRALASSFGPIHDSRAGPGSYYRYQPRRIGAWTDPPEPHSGILRDPSRRGPDGRPRGLLRSVHIHESVVARIADGTDSYAPITLPRSFLVIPPQQEGENAPQADSEGSTVPDEATGPKPLISSEIRRRLADPEVTRRRADAAEWIWDAVLRRRLIYFATLALTLWLALLPFRKTRWTKVEDLCSDDRCVLPWLIDQTKYLVPKFGERWIDAYANQPATFLILLGSILFLLWFGKRSEAVLQDRSRQIWRATLGQGDWPDRLGGLSRLSWAALRAVRTSGLYQFIIISMKWYVLPTLLGFALMAILLYGLAAAATQVRLAWVEPRGHFCRNDDQVPPAIGAGASGKIAMGAGVRGEMDIARICTRIGRSVTQDWTYEVRFTNVRRPDGKPGWSDGGTEATPQGLKASGLGNIGSLGAPFRRVVGAPYLLPLVQIRGEAARRWWPSVHIQKVPMMPDGTGGYVGSFVAKRSGGLSMFVNDAAPPLGLWKRFYGNNQGNATVTIRAVAAPRKASRSRG